MALVAEESSQPLSAGDRGGGRWGGGGGSPWAGSGVVLEKLRLGDRKDEVRRGGCRGRIFLAVAVEVVIEVAVVVVIGIIGETEEPLIS